MPNLLLVLYDEVKISLSDVKLPIKSRSSCFIIYLTLFLSCGVLCSGELYNDRTRAETVAIQLHKPDLRLAQDIAKKHGYQFDGQIGSLEGYYLLKRKNGRISKRHALNTVGSDHNVAWHELQTAKIRVKRDILPERWPRDIKATKGFSLQLPWGDPLYPQQWFLNKGAVGQNDMHVTEAWKLGYTGKGVVVSILDDGIQGTHPDLAQNYDPDASTDINDKDRDPTPRNNGDNKHGTRCAGEVAAVAGNNWCGVGVAFNSSIGGVRMLDGPVSDSVEAASLSLNPSHIDIYSASWGPEDDGKTVDGPGPLAKQAFYDGITKGRKGKGNIFIWASGNGGSHQDSCSCDGYTTSIYTLSVSSATYDNSKPWYLEECPSTLTTTYSSGGIGQPAIATVDMPDSCTDQHTGTSASAPLAAGIVALALEANPELTWRDMQHLVVRTSDPTPLLQNSGWIVNGVRRKVSNKFGYGMMNAEALVRLATRWTKAPAQHVCSYQYHIDNPNPRPLVGKFSTNFTLTVPGCQGDNAVNYLEQVHAVITIQYSQRGDLQITLISPMGTKSVLLPPRPGDANKNGFNKWPFLSVQQWGENPRGNWMLIIENVGSAENKGAFIEWSLMLYGTAEPPQPDVINNNDITSSTVGSVDNQVTSAEKEKEHPNQDQIFMQNCDKLCDPLSGCFKMNSSSDCVKCSSFSLFKRNRGGVTCVEKCGDGYYTDLKMKRCNKCLSDCLTCSGGDTCDSCPQEMVLVIAATPDHLLHGRCYANCPDGFEKSADGKSCSLKKTANKCGNGYFLTRGNVCVARCPDGEFASTSFECQVCSLVCRTCIGPNATECIDCAVGFKRNEKTNRCEKFIKGVGYVVGSNNGCSEARHYFDAILNECKPCPDNSTLDECAKPKHPGGLSLGKIVIILCSAAILIFFLVFICLMWKDRHYDKNARLYAYSKLPVQYALGSKEMIITSDKPITNGHAASPSLEEDFNLLSENSDEEDTLFEPEKMNGTLKS